MNMGLSEPGRLFRYFAKKTNKKFDFFLKIVYNIYTKLRENFKTKIQPCGAAECSFACHAKDRGFKSRQGCQSKEKLKPNGQGCKGRDIS